MRGHEHRNYSTYIGGGLFRHTMTIDEAVKDCLDTNEKLNKRIEALETTINNANRYWGQAYCKACSHKDVCRINLTVGQHCEMFLEAEDD